jgi:amino acid adenylation domain-containing protein
MVSQIQIEGYRLSPQQLHLWLLQQNSNAYRSQCTVRLEGELNVDALRAALQRVVQRHDILRTSFMRTPGIKFPVQVISAETRPAPIELTFEERALSESEIERLVDEPTPATADSEINPVISAAVYSVAADKHFVVLSVPALYADSRSLVNLVREIANLYADDSTGSEVVQYLQFSEWQNEIINDDEAEVGKSFWRKQGDVLLYPPPALPFQSISADAFSPRTVASEIEPETVAGLDELAEKFDTTTAIVLQACWQTLLWRLTGQANIVIGSVHDGRKYEELSHSLGLLARTLPIHQHFDERATFREILQQVAQRAGDAADWMEYFTHDTAADEMAHGNFIPVAFEFVDLDLENANASFSLRGLRSSFDRYNVKLTCGRRDNSLLADFHYDSSVLREEDVRRHCEQFHQLLLSVTQNPETLVGKLEIISDHERRRLVFDFNDTRADYASDKTIHQLLEEQAARTPDDIAVIFADQQLTYAELHSRANQLAHYLRALDVGPEVLVGIYMERSLEMLVGMLGVLKAGGAYVPLDLTYPQERLAFMLQDARVSVVLAQDDTAERLPDTEATVLPLDGYWPMIEAESEETPDGGATAENAAYVIYTSGSTGKPKGVVIPHRGLVNYLTWAIKNYKVAEGRGATVHSPLGFDLTVTSIFTPLLVGRSVALVPESQGLEGFNAILRQEKNLSLIKLTPSHLELLNQMVSPEDIGGTTNVLIVGGEALWYETVDFWRTHAAETRVVNEYGPTETVVGCCVYEVANKTTNSAAVPIGRPIDNAELYVLDNYMQPVPTGVLGEIYIGGVQLARGYLGRPDLTAERFIPHPFASEPGQRLYRTGDVARFLANGEIEYVGRTDQQTKIRGYRIELGEIEVLLAQHEAVREVAVIAREDVIGDKRIVAYVVMIGDQESSTATLRHFLQERLPDFMMPSAFVVMDALPLSPNGKLDRNLLPMPGLSLGSREETYVEPRTALERILATVWSETIGVERVGVQDNFFELGGHSLLATQVLARVQEDFQVDLPLRIMFEGMTVEQMAQAVLENEAVPGQSEKIAQALLKIESMSEAEFAEALRQKRGLDESDGRSQKA